MTAEREKCQQIIAIPNRTAENGIPKKTLEGKFNGKRQRWTNDDLNEYAKGVTIADSIGRGEWRKEVKAAKVLQKP